MRYFLVTYYKKANGQIDEVVTVAKNLKMRDIQTASVILDCKYRAVQRCRVEGTVPEDTSWGKIAGYYQTHYPDIFQRLGIAPSP